MPALGPASTNDPGPHNFLEGIRNPAINLPLIRQYSELTSSTIDFLPLHTSGTIRHRVRLLLTTTVVDRDFRFTRLDDEEFPALASLCV